ncbi:hypothetical protein EGW08_011362 [Elysia chlorotica]|uniref:LITAF domain-containing protein n=1 Tax=Elysia chlorotica TaxID=188477 RepID=A0A3S1HJS6_ELYCH|nr:hypothetical protein EGW08_011362 [Elysia chlorotica]
MADAAASDLRSHVSDKDVLKSHPSQVATEHENIQDEKEDDKEEDTNHKEEIEIDKGWEKRQAKWLKSTTVPQYITCPSCGKDGTTMITSRPGKVACLFCLCLAGVGCFYGCCLIPFCVKQCQNTQHLCPNCGIVLATKRLL